MSKIDENYHNLLSKILEKGYLYDDPNRKGIKRLEIPSYTFRHEFKDGFPAISTKKLHYKNVVTELLWFLKGDTNIKYLVDNGCNIWNKDAYNYYLRSHPDYKRDYNFWLERIPRGIAKIGDLGPVYGKQWRDFNGVDQIKDLIQGLKDKPLGTEHLVSAWNPADKHLMALPPCHYGFQIVVRPLNIHERAIIGRQTRDIFTEGVYKSSEELDQQGIVKYGFELHWNQRSVDTFLGLPYNIASYATLALIIEKITGYKALAIQGDLKKVHLYDNSIDAVKEQLSRDPNKYNSPKIDTNDQWIDAWIKCFNENKIDITRLFNELLIDDFELENYESYPAINVEMKERDE